MRKEKWKGRVFSEYTVIEEEKKKPSKRVKCRCSCGKEVWVWKSNLTSGNSTSCHGYGRNLRTHNRWKHPCYKSWSSMKNRCLNKTSSDYPRYGGRGIEICKRWMSIENFITDMGVPPTKKHTLDRIDVNLGYYKKNCRWASRKEQSRNKRNTLFIEGISLAEWCDNHEISYKLGLDRFKRGMSPEEILVTPVLNKYSKGQLCCVLGCENQVKTRKMCNKHYLQWWQENKWLVQFRRRRVIG